MIKKLGLLILICILVFGTYNVYKNGFKFKEVQALSFSQLENKNSILNSKIDELESLNGKEYNSAKTRLESARQGFNSSKRSYDVLAATASAEDIAEANKREEYLLDYLWIKIGNYANVNGIKVLIDSSANTPVIDFDVTGPYISIINFIYDLENDAELKFNVDNIVMEGAQNENIDAKASFTVSGVNVITSEV